MEFCIQLKIGHSMKWYEPESILEKETHKILWDFEKQIDHQILSRRPDVVIINKKKRACCTVDFVVFTDNWVKINENEKKSLDPVRELKMLWYMKITVIPSITGALGSQKLRKGAGSVGNRTTSWDHPNYRITKISLDIVESPGDLRKLAATQTPMKAHQFMLVWKLREKYNSSFLKTAEISSKGKHPGCPPCKILWNILKMDNGET